MSTLRLVPVPALLAAALLMAGCASDDDSEPAASTGSIASGTATPSGSGGDDEGDGGETPGEDDGDAPSFPSEATPAEQAASGDSLVTVTDVRTGRHDGFDRVVVEVEGEGLPGWDVRYVDQPTEQGSGNPVEVSGNAVLQVTVSGVGYPYDTGVEEFGRGAAVPLAGTEVVTDVVYGATFEGTAVAFIGTTGESPFRVYLLEGPTRIVIEVADAT